MASVERILTDLDVHKKPQLVVFNKRDQVPDQGIIEPVCRRFDAVAVSALERGTFEPLTERLRALLPDDPYAAR